jgi:hypothetical protein
MNIIQTVITIELTEAECKDYCTEMSEALGIIRTVDGGNTRTGLAVLRKLEALFVAHGFGIRPVQQAWVPQQPPYPQQGYPPQGFPGYPPAPPQQEEPS